jgi:hypothetical protein
MIAPVPQRMMRPWTREGKVLRRRGREEGRAPFRYWYLLLLHLPLPL